MFVPEAGAALEQVDDGECVCVFYNQDSVVIEGLLGTALAMAGLPLQDKASSCRLCLCVFATRFPRELLSHLHFSHALSACVLRPPPLPVWSRARAQRRHRQQQQQARALLRLFDLY